MRASKTYSPVLRSLNKSRKWNACSILARDLYVRLLLDVDDAGRHSADAALVKAEVAALCQDHSAENIPESLGELQSVGLIALYEHGGEPLLAIVDHFSVLRKDRKPKVLHPDPEGLLTTDWQPVVSESQPVVNQRLRSDAISLTPTLTPTPTPEEAPAGGAPARRRKPAKGVHPELVRFWQSEWGRTRLGNEYKIQSKDAAAIAKCLKLADEDPAAVKERMTRLLESGDKWLAENAFPSLLQSRWNQLALDVEPTGTKGRSFGGDIPGMDFLRQSHEAEMARRAAEGVQ